MKLLFVCIAAFVCTCSSLHGKVDTNCLKWLCDYDVWSRWEGCTNPDSVYIDTCRASVDPNNMWDYLYAKSPFRVRFYKTDILPLPAVPKDSVVEVTWGSISVQYPAIRARFAELEQQFGSFFLRREYPDVPISSNGSGVFLMRFVQRVNTRDVEKVVNRRTEHTDILYFGQTAIPICSVEPGAAAGITQGLALAPNPARSELSITLQYSGKHRLVIADMLGRPVMSYPVVCYAPPCESSFSIAHLPVGVYTIVCGRARQLFVVRR